MRFKCNSMGCEHEFETDITEQDIDKENYKSPNCPKCNDQHNGCYRIDTRGRLI